ncbi:hypothetical protein FOMA001_g18299 [Fusarium oxysporum f. sp. matthiolae]|nr:hypothetical protein FOMA001_g18299 [Fusarium oxysporum f. sp. matthiolae]
MPLPNDQPELGWLNVVNQVNAIVPRSPSLRNASPDVAPLNPSHSNPISFSAHKILDWPLITSQLPEEVQAIYQNCGPDYATLMEMKRPNVPATRMADLAGETSVLAKLSLSIVKQICDAFFTTFNLAHPIVDQKFFLHHTLPIAIQRGFEADVESCVVLAVMALGCWSIQAIERAGYSKNRYDKDLRLDNLRVRGIPGLFFHNHARIRHGFLVNDHSMQSCQFHLLSG